MELSIACSFVLFWSLYLHGLISEYKITVKYDYTIVQLFNCKNPPD